MNVTSQQVDKLIEIGTSMLHRKYTLTGAADWQMLYIIGGAVIALLVYIWYKNDKSNAAVCHKMDSIQNVLTTLGSSLRVEWRSDLEKHEQHAKEEINILWKEIHDCQDTCCPRGGRRSYDKDNNKRKGETR